MHYSDIDSRDIGYPVDKYNFPKPHKVNNRYKREYPENIKSSDHITDNDDSYEDEEYERV